MTTDIAVKPQQNTMLEALRHTVAPGLTDAEFQLFAEIVKATGLNPVTKEVWAIKAGGRLQLMTGINGFLRIANSHPQFDGMEVENQWDGKNLVACTVKVHRKDRKYPSIATAYMSEYAKQSPIWKQMPSVMLAKCAKSLAIREAFIQELGGLYTAEEMPAEFSASAVEIKPADELPESFEKLEHKPSKAVTTYYNTETLTGDQLIKAEKYLTNSGAKQVAETIWKSPIRLDKLTQCIEENYSEGN